VVDVARQRDRDYFIVNDLGGLEHDFSQFAANIGTNNTTVFSGNLGQACAFLDTLHIKLTTPFTYNPPWAAC
jgi:hypothetical protein